MRFWQSAWTLLVLANLFWSGNIVLGRGVAGVVPPIALAYWRWTGAFFIAVGFAWPYLRRDWPTMLRQWPLMLVLSATGVASYNAMCYIGLTSTTALNALLLQSVSPLIIVLWAVALFGERPTLLQVTGILVSFLGVIVIAGGGSPEALLHLRVNPGDLWILAAVVISGAYAALLRRRPGVHSLSFLVAIMGIGSCMILPFYAGEIAAGARIHNSWEAWMSLAYIAVFPSFVAYLFFNRSIELIGAARAGQSMHLMPVFGSVLTLLFLGENFLVYHAVGISLIACGILLASWKATPSARLMAQPDLAPEATESFDTSNPPSFFQ